MTNNQNEQAMVEKVERAICCPLGECQREVYGCCQAPGCNGAARAVLTALREPTEAMTLAGCRHSLPGLFRAGLHPQQGDGPSTRQQLAATISDTNRRWQAMIDEALK